MSEPAAKTEDMTPPKAQGVWEIDPVHSAVTFTCRWVLVRARGRFTSFAGRVVVADDPSESSVVATIDAASIDTAFEVRDGHLRDEKFLDAEHHPTMTFHSTSLRPVAGDRWALAGDLTIRDVTCPINLQLQVHGTTVDPFGTIKAGFTATGELSREAYGLTWNMPLPGGGSALSDTVQIELDVELKRSEDAPPTD